MKHLFIPNLGGGVNALIASSSFSSLSSLECLSVHEHEHPWTTATSSSSSSAGRSSRTIRDGTGMTKSRAALFVEEQTSTTDRDPKKVVCPNCSGELSSHHRANYEAVRDRGMQIKTCVGRSFVRSLARSLWILVRVEFPLFTSAHNFLCCSRYCGGPELNVNWINFANVVGGGLERIENIFRTVCVVWVWNVFFILAPSSTVAPCSPLHSTL